MRRGKNSNKRQNIKDRSGPAKPVVPINLSEPEYLILTTKIYKSISDFLGIVPRSKKGYKICAPINSSVWICISIYQFILPIFVFLEEYSNHHLFFCSIPEPGNCISHQLHFLDLEGCVFLHLVILISPGRHSDSFLVVHQGNTV